MSKHNKPTNKSKKRKLLSDDFVATKKTNQTQKKQQKLFDRDVEEVDSDSDATNNKVRKRERNERIYIGGLANEDILNNLKKRLSKSYGNSSLVNKDNKEYKISLLSIDDGSIPSSNTNMNKLRTFLHLDFQVIETPSTAQKNNTTGTSASFEEEDKNDDNDIAYQQIKSQYHNIKWKGCKLIVEKARPNFLQRLEIEREEYRIKQQHLQELQEKQRQQALLEKQKEEEVKVRIFSPNSLDSKSHTTSSNNSNIPRQLRIRRKFAEEVFVVDTKPKYITGSYTKNFSKYYRTKMNKRRSTHFRFEDEEEVTMTEGYGLLSHVSDDGSGSSSAGSSNIDDDASTSSDSSDDSQTSAIVSNKPSSHDRGILDADIQQQNKKGSSYVWSDDEESNESDDSDEEEKEKPTNNVHRDDSIPGDSFVSNEEEETTQDESLLVNEQDKFVWSSDEEEDEDDDKFNYKNDTKPTTENDNNGEIDLSQDVASNLNILAQMFGGSIDTKPTITSTSTSTTLMNDDINNANNNNNKTSTKSSLIMQRFDPTDIESRELYEVASEQQKEQESMDSDNTESDDDDDDEEETSNEEEFPCTTKSDEYLEEQNKSDSDRDVLSSESGSSTNGVEEEDNEIEETTEEETTPPKDYIYEQNKLESIFQKAREEEEELQQQKLQGSTNGENQNNHSFNFFANEDDINNDKREINQKKEEDTTGGGFSFSFSFPNEEETNNKTDTNPTMYHSASSSNVAANSDDHHMEPPSNEKSNRNQYDKITEASKNNSKVQRSVGIYPHVPQTEIDFWLEDFYTSNPSHNILNITYGGIQQEQKDTNNKPTTIDGIPKEEEEEEELLDPELKDQEDWLEERKTLTSDWRSKQKMAILYNKKNKKSKKSRY
eukprot:CAMPEP_0178948108 /NCGR_PEP_ID=MMETSP0789-20121207/5285_1 /TAXON_ID=3005 /ORGANISM="Rhizosolenia setigera, Strain CCMP 1694" /LENGTH=883 /DNA_ID=CAMNT_0020628429 /DNA_START=60 /DNA_END=2711 /DNA_ORIENTATION=-